MNKKVVIPIISVLVILVGIFAVMSLRGESDDLLSKLEEDVVAQKPLDQVKLTFYFEAQEAKYTREVLDQVEKKIENRVNAKLDFKFIEDNPEGYLNSIESILSSGQPCDAFYYSRQFLKSLGTLASEGVIKDITELFPQYAPNYFSQLSKEETSAASVDGRIYAITNRIPSTQMRCAVVREDFMKKYDIPDIKSYDDYEVYLETIKKNEPEAIPMMFYETAIGLFAEANGYVILDYTQGLVYKWDDPEMKIMAWEQTPEYRKGIETIKKWYEKGYLLENVGVMQIDENAISSGKWASFIATLGSDLEFNTILMAKGINWRYKAYPLYPNSISERNSPMNTSMVISAKSEHPDRVLMFVDWLQSDQSNYDSLMYGISGKHYTLKGNRIELPKDVKPEESCFRWGWHWPFSNIAYERLDAGSPADSTKEYFKTINEKTKYPPHMGFVPDYTPVSDIMTWRQMSFYTTEQKIYSGNLNAEDVESYIKDQKVSGGDKLVSEIQRQLDKWKK